MSDEQPSETPMVNEAETKADSSVGAVPDIVVSPDAM